MSLSSCPVQAPQLSPFVDVTISVSRCQRTSSELAPHLPLARRRSSPLTTSPPVLVLQRRHSTWVQATSSACRSHSSVYMWRSLMMQFLLLVRSLQRQRPRRPSQRSIHVGRGCLYPG